MNIINQKEKRPDDVSASSTVTSLFKISAHVPLIGAGITGSVLSFGALLASVPVSVFMGAIEKPFYQLHDIKNIMMRSMMWSAANITASTASTCIFLGLTAYSVQEARDGYEHLKTVGFFDQDTQSSKAERHEQAKIEVQPSASPSA